MRFAVAVLLSVAAVPVVAQDARDWQICANASRTYTPQRQTQACTAVLESGQLTREQVAVALYNRGNASLALSNLVSAMEDYSQSIGANPTDPGPYKARCWAQSIIGGLEAALSDCSAALNLQPNQDDALESRGIVYLRLGQFDNARKDFDKALQVNAGLAGSLFGRGLTKIRLGDANGGNADLMAARVLRRDIDAQFARFGLKP